MPIRFCGKRLAEKGSRGHADVPIEGNVALEVFTAVTYKTPRGLNYERNEGNSDNIFWLALAQRWPPGTWNRRSALSIWRNGLSVLRLPPTASSFPSAQPRISQAICSSEKRIAGSPRIRGTSQQHSWSMHFAALVTLRLCLSVP